MYDKVSSVRSQLSQMAERCECRNGERQCVCVSAENANKVQFLCVAKKTLQSCEESARLGRLCDFSFFTLTFMLHLM